MLVRPWTKHTHIHKLSEKVDAVDMGKEWHIRSRGFIYNIWISVDMDGQMSIFLFFLPRVEPEECTE